MMNGHDDDIQEINKELNDELLNCYKGELTGFYYYGPDKYLVRSVFKDVYKEYINFKTRSEDIWIVTFPRSGTTLTQELVWLLTHNLDYKTAKQINLWDRALFLEFETLFHPKTKQRLLDNNAGNIVNQNIINEMSESACIKLNEMQSPRVIKSHFPLSMLPRGIKDTNPKIIYVARHPNDVALSFYHLIRLCKLSDYKGSYDEFLSQFKRGLVNWGPYWNHIKEGWDRRSDENVLFLFYENMIKDMKETIHVLAKFLSVTITENDVEKLADHINIKNFRQNLAVNLQNLNDIGMLNKEEESFIRQGYSRGDGKEYNSEMLQSFNKWIEENIKRINIKFPI